MVTGAIELADIGTPQEMGLPVQFTAWRRGQKDALQISLNWLLSPTRFMAMCMPTGSGKSLTYVALALQAGRACVLTSTKGLQDQLLRDFSRAGLRDIRGMGNYPCLAVSELDTFPMFRDDAKADTSCEEGPCHGGFKCDLMQAGCTYFDSKRAARQSALIVTNYSYWLRVMNQEKEDAGLGSIDLLIMDEAHEAPDELAGYLSIEVGAAEMEQLTGADFPSDSTNFEGWKSWALQLIHGLNGRIQSEEEQMRQGRLTHAKIRHLKSLKNLRDRLASVAGARGEWVQDSYRDYRGSRKLKFDPVDVKAYRDELFQRIPHVLFVSATVRPKTLSMFGLVPGSGPADAGKDAYSFMESTAAFAPSRRPVIHVPTVRMRHTMSADEMHWWVTKIDQIIDRRLGRRGIVHTTSFKRAQFLAAWSKHSKAGRFCLPSGPSTRDTIARWKRGELGDILVSPSVTTGHDFAGDQCRFQIIGKVPFPDTRSKVLQARESHDKDFGAYQAMQTIVQTAGRGVRSADDWCETLVVDDNWVWFVKKYKEFAPKWFIQALKWSNGVPEAMDAPKQIRP